MTDDKDMQAAAAAKTVWRSRGYLPHYEDLDKSQSITFRLADSLPRKVLDQMELELETLPKERQAPERRRRIEEWLDAGSGCCALRHPAVAGTVQDTLLRFEGDRYRLLAWCIMPNHVHVLIEPQESLAKIVQSWKSFTGRWAMQRNAELGLGVPGKSFWMREYWDRFIRDQKHFNSVIDYIHQNPVKARLCKQAANWPWSSARLERATHPGNAEHQLGQIMEREIKANTRNPREGN